MMPTNRKRRTRKVRLVLTPEQLQYLRDGDYEADQTLDVFLWAGAKREVRAAFEAVRGDYPPGHFGWAEKAFGGKR